MRAIEERLNRLEVGDSTSFPVGTDRDRIEDAWYHVLGRTEEIDIVTCELGVTVHVLDGDELDGKMFSVVCLVTVATVLICSILLS